MIEASIPHHPVPRIPGLASGIVTDDGNAKITDRENREREGRALSTPHRLSAVTGSPRPVLGKFEDARRFGPDSALEEAGFEPLVPRPKTRPQSG
jgi:hypothetical protein